MTHLQPQALPAVVPSPGEMPAASASAEPLDLIFIDGLVAQTVIGIHDNELHQTQPVRIDVCAGVPRPRACDSDDIADTIDYSLL
ncbi:MAG: hypothetical protein RL375_3604, partial [Pseudomonadota bacterium]